LLRQSDLADNPQADRMTDATHPHRRPFTRLEATPEAMRQRIAENVAIDPDRLRMHDLGKPSPVGVTGDRWQIFYGDHWQDLPWHFDGSLSVTRELCGSCCEPGQFGRNNPYIADA